MNVGRSPFGGWEIDKLFEAVSFSAESVRVCAESMTEEMIVGTYSAAMNIQSQLDEVLRQQRMMQMTIEAAQSKTHLLDFLMEQLSMSTESPALAPRLEFS